MNCRCDVDFLLSGNGHCGQKLPRNYQQTPNMAYQKGGDNSSGASGACVGSSGRGARLNHHFCLCLRYFDNLFLHFEILYRAIRSGGRVRTCCAFHFAPHEMSNSVGCWHRPVLRDIRLARLTPTRIASSETRGCIINVPIVALKYRLRSRDYQFLARGTFFCVPSTSRTVRNANQ